MSESLAAIKLILAPFLKSKSVVVSGSHCLDVCFLMYWEWEGIKVSWLLALAVSTTTGHWLLEFNLKDTIAGRQNKKFGHKLSA